MCNAAEIGRARPRGGPRASLLSFPLWRLWRRRDFRMHVTAAFVAARAPASASAFSTFPSPERPSAAFSTLFPACFPASICCPRLRDIILICFQKVQPLHISLSRSLTLSLSFFLSITPIHSRATPSRATSKATASAAAAAAASASSVSTRRSTRRRALSLAALALLLTAALTLLSPAPAPDPHRPASALATALAPLRRLLMPVIRAGVVHDTATVAGTPDVVCRYLAHFSNTPDWDPGCLSGKPVDDSPLQVGKQFALVTEFKGTKSDMM